jgi:predicted secreted hydrolase
VRRRAFLGLMGLPLVSRAAKLRYPVVTPQPQLVFPRDHGAHPDYRTEWWYVTGWLDGPMGFQITFFRARPEEQSDNPSSFNARQVLVAHAAIADPKRGRLIHEERAARAGFTLAHAETERTGVWIDDWRLVLEGDKYHSQIAAREFDLDLTFFTSDRPLLQGEAGFSRKGHRPEEASYYYSQPHLHVVGSVNGRQLDGSAWLDHEWSSAYLAPEAAGWDWTGINLFDGSSLMAFRMRAKKGGVHYAPPGVSFEPIRVWKSPRTAVEYPVQMRVRARGMDLVLKPLMDDQELDARPSPGTIYWEGAVRAFDGRSEVGRGYLELTGYWRPMSL